MKKAHLSILFVLLVLSFSMNKAQAQNLNQSKAKARAYARVVTNFSAVKTSDLTFENFPTHDWDGNPIVTPHNNPSSNGNNSTGYKIDYAANFFVTGGKETAFSISLPNTPIALKNISDTKTIHVSNWSADYLDNTHEGPMADGYYKVGIGATLDIGTLKDKPVGIYTGIYKVTFDFN
ncbi:MAG: DUF4402 domain-containing protein [Bacteroidales bacterium]|nr:DUF4402 domain-containing protein [Bacteroidales bacterium]MCF8457627.1 DUF4402 domain-containing protein [Bacteroidales bacterium]